MTQHASIYQKKAMPSGQSFYSLDEIYHYLDTHWLSSNSYENITKLNQAFDGILSKKPTVLISGTSGKSTTIHFLTQLFTQEHVSFGTLTSPHIFSYHERIQVNGQSIPHQQLIAHASNVLHQATQLQLTPTSKELLLISAALYFNEQDVDLVILENNETFSIDPTLLITPIVHGITRIVEPKPDSDVFHALEILMKQTSTKTEVISADQNKNNLNMLKQATLQAGASWSMPIRKIVNLSYPYEQMYGRCAALAERIATLCISYLQKNQQWTSHKSILVKHATRRGRPSLQDLKKAAEDKSMNLPTFWQQASMKHIGHFELTEYQGMRTLLDTAQNTDALQNVLLGVRLLHYKHQAKNLQLILGFQEQSVDSKELIKILISFFKKLSGTVFMVPVKNSPSEHIAYKSCNIEIIANALKSSGIKAYTCASLEDALHKSLPQAQHEHSLTVVAGAQDMIKEFYQLTTPQ